MGESVLGFLGVLGQMGDKIVTGFLNLIWNFLEFLIHLLFDWINIPAFPDTLKSSINGFFDLIFGNLSLLGFFVRPTTLKIVIPLILFLVNFKYIYKLVMWIIRKIPFINMK